MADTPPVDLKIFDSLYRVETDSPSVRELMLDLWAPFVTDHEGAAFEVVIKETPTGWDALIPGVAPFPLTDIWQIANALKHSLVEHALARSASFLAIHAAFLEKADARVLLAGPSGGGKTTLCLQLLEDGWSYGSDDLAPIVLGENAILPFPRALSVRDSETFARYLPKWRPPYELERPEGPFQLPPTLFDLMEPAPCRATHAFIIDRDADPSVSVTPLTTAMAVVRLSQYVRWQGDVQLDPLTTVLRDCETSVVSYPTPSEGAALIQQACAG